VLTLDLEIVADEVVRVRVDMGRPILEAARIPTTLDPDKAHGNRIIARPLPVLDGIAADWGTACGLDPRMTCVSMGNPHLVLFCRDVASVPLTTVGPILERHPLFPRRINVHFVQPHSKGEVTMRTWERGSGITLACGTGASAVCVAGALADRIDRRILAHLPGGDLELEWGDDDHVYMTGPAVEVFSGEWPERIPAAV
jgi:diaminopimelate epimerase